MKWEYPLFFNSLILKPVLLRAFFVFLVYVSINLIAFFSNKFFPFFILRYMKLAFSCFWKANLIFRKFFVIKFLPFLPSDRFILEYFSYKTFINVGRMNCSKNQFYRVFFLICNHIFGIITSLIQFTLNIWWKCIAINCIPKYDNFNEITKCPNTYRIPQ